MLHVQRTGILLKHVNLQRFDSKNPKKTVVAKMYKTSSVGILKGNKNVFTFNGNVDTNVCLSIQYITQC